MRPILFYLGDFTVLKLAVNIGRLAVCLPMNNRRMERDALMKTKDDMLPFYRPIWLHGLKFCGRHPFMGAMPLLAGILAIKILPPRVLEIAAFRKRNQETMRMAERMSDT